MCAHRFRANFSYGEKLTWKMGSLLTFLSLQRRSSVNANDTSNTFNFIKIYFHRRHRASSSTFSAMPTEKNVLSPKADCSHRYESSTEKKKKKLSSHTNPTSIRRKRQNYECLAQQEEAEFPSINFMYSEKATTANSTTMIFVETKAKRWKKKT